MLDDCHYLNLLCERLGDLADMAFREDLGGGDITAEVLELRKKEAQARLICREPVSMCGAAWFDVLVERYRDFVPAAEVWVTCRHRDGTRLPAGSVLFGFTGNAADILALERTFLNFCTRAIGIANATYELVEIVRRYNDHTQILDTRKTLPGYRYFDKYAVLCGGGKNHRMNLGDQVLIKENHIAKLGGVADAIGHVRATLKKNVAIQIEVRDMDQLKQALACNCPLIMLDNFTPEMVHQACELERGSSLLEVSGGISAANIGAYCHPRLDRISIGAITHSTKAPDLSLLMKEV